MVPSSAAVAAPLPRANFVANGIFFDSARRRSQSSRASCTFPARAKDSQTALCSIDSPGRGEKRRPPSPSTGWVTAIS